MGIPAETDILVIGGGPAGSCAATELARRGYGVVLIDKARHPREVVGESILPHAWRYFDRLGATKLVEREGFVKKAGGVVAWEDQVTEISFRDFDFDRPGLHVERAVLDHLLLNNARDAGVQVFEGVAAESFVEDRGQGAQAWLVDTESRDRHRVTCRFLVDASGQGCFVARQLGAVRLDPDFRFIALWGYFTGSRYISSGGVVRPFEDITDHPPMTFVCSRGNWGWAWHIPLRKHTSVGILVPVEDYKKAADAARSREQYFLDACMSTPSLRALLEGAQLCDGGVRLMRDFSYASGKIAGSGLFRDRRCRRIRRSDLFHRRGGGALCRRARRVGDRLLATSARERVGLSRPVRDAVGRARPALSHRGAALSGPFRAGAGRRQDLLRLHPEGGTAADVVRGIDDVAFEQSRARRRAELDAAAAETLRSQGASFPIIAFSRSDGARSIERPSCGLRCFRSDSQRTFATKSASTGNRPHALALGLGSRTRQPFGEEGHGLAIHLGPVPLAHNLEICRPFTE
jgi:flavin-dependent dehydrogenase